MDTKQGLKAFAEGRRDVLMIDPRRIEPEVGFNSRDFSAAENIEHIAGLKASIIESGIKVPLTVRLRESRVFLADGECRWRAVMLAIEEGHEIKVVPCQPEERYLNEADRLANQALFNSGKQFSPLEMAHLCRRLIGHGWDQAQIAKRLGKSASYVSYCLGLLTLPEEAQQMVRDGEVSASAAKAAITSEGEANGVEVLREAVAVSKEAGKTKATVGRVRQAAAKRAPAGKAMGITLSVAKTEKVGNFLHWLMTDAEDIGEIHDRADKLFKEILA
jgi:ParB family transcriptional regulator, chromosome partitioning protein